MPAILILTLAWGWLTAGMRARTADGIFRARLTNKAEDVALLLDENLVDSLTFTHGNRGDEVYRRLSERLSGLVFYMPVHAAHILLRDKGEQWVYGPTSRSSSHAEFRAPGTPVHPPDQARHSFYEGQPFHTLWERKEGCIVPAVCFSIRTYHGAETRGLLCLEIDEGERRAAILAARNLPLAIAFLLSLLLLSGFLVCAGLPCAKRFAGLARDPELAGPVWVAYLGLLLTLSAALWLLDDDRHDRLLSFDAITFGQVRALREEVKDMKRDVDSLARFFEGSHYVDREEFESFIGRRARLAPVLGYVLVAHVRDSERESFLHTTREEGLPEFRVWPMPEEDASGPDGPRPPWTPILHAAPQEAHDALPGFNLATQPALRTALQISAQNGLPCVVDARGLPGAEIPGALLYLQPVFPRHDANAPRGAVRGYTGGLFLPEHLIRNAVGQPADAQRMIDLSLVDPGGGGSAYRMCAEEMRTPLRQRTSRTPAGRDGRLSLALPLWMADRSFIVYARPTRLFAAAHPIRTAWVAGSAGLLLTALLTTLVVFLRRRQTTLETLVAERTRALHDSEGNLKAILNASTESIFLMDGEGVILVANEELAHRLRDGTATLTGAKVFDVMPPGSAVRWEAAAATVMATGKSINFEEDHDGRTLAYSIYPVQAPNGETYRLAVIGMDMTRRKQLEKGKRDLEIRLDQKRKLESLGLLAGGISHNFNNILMTIIGYAELARDVSAATAPQHEHLRQIVEAARRASGLCMRMLEYAGLSSGAFRNIDPGKMIMDIQPHLEASLPQQALLRVDIAEDLAQITGDPEQLRQVVFHLVANASEALEGKQGAIRLSAANVLPDAAEWDGAEWGNNLAPGLHVCIEVSDTGCGMDETTRRRLFDPFFSTKFTGRGLGLSAVLGIMRAHGGAIRVSSQRGQGTVFKLFLPAGNTSQEAD